MRPSAEWMNQAQDTINAVCQADGNFADVLHVTNLQELYAWMYSKRAVTDVGIDSGIAQGRYPKLLAAFVVWCNWLDWQQHAVYVLHGRIYLRKLRAARATMTETKYRDHYAGALAHRAVGLMHVARCALASGLEAVSLPGWKNVAWGVGDIAAQAVQDMRISHDLRSKKCREGTSPNAVDAYLASERNLRAALLIRANCRRETWGLQAAGALLRNERILALLVDVPQHVGNVTVTGMENVNVQGPARLVLECLVPEAAPGPPVAPAAAPAAAYVFCLLCIALVGLPMLSAVLNGDRSSNFLSS